MKKVLLVLLLGFSGVIVAQNASFLFLQTSSRANLDKLHNNNYLLTLNNTAEFVNYVMEKPKRESGAISLNEFIALWTNKKLHNNFSQNPPRAFLIMISERGVRQTAVAIISNPGHSLDTVTYQISALGKQKLQSGKLKYIALFFEDINADPKLFR